MVSKSILPLITDFLPLAIQGVQSLIRASILEVYVGALL